MRLRLMGCEKSSKAIHHYLKAKGIEERCLQLYKPSRNHSDWRLYINIADRTVLRFLDALPEINCREEAL